MDQHAILQHQCLSNISSVILFSVDDFCLFQLWHSDLFPEPFFLSVLLSKIDQNKHQGSHDLFESGHNFH